MELKFLTGHDGRNVKREHARRACTPCRQKKKRCFHHQAQPLDRATQAASYNLRDGQLQSTSIPRPAVNPRTPVPSTPEEPHHTSPLCEIEQREPVYSTASSASTARSIPAKGTSDPDLFACDTNPLVTLLDDPESRLRKGQSQRGDVGASLHNRAFSSESNTSQPRPGPAGGSPRGLAGNAHLLPPTPKQEALADLYFRRIHPVLPLLDEDDTRSQFMNGTLSLPLFQSVCLAASKDRSAAPFLSLGTDPTVLPLERFSTLLYTDITKNMPNRDERRILTIQILAILSLHAWGPNGCEDASLNLSLAVHHSHTLGLHLARPGKASESSQKLFWCLWSLDRWNSAINGRPLMIHDYDMGQEVADVLPRFQPSFRIWLRLADQLGWVIRSYRPVMDGNCEPELEISTFEEIVDDSSGWETSPEILGSLELFHHAIVLLSTHSKGLQGRSRSRMTKIRQSQSILSVAALIRKQQARDSLPISISAYAISLAFSVTYSQFKETKLPSTRSLAIENLELFHQCLRPLGDTWWLAAAMAHLSKNALDGIYRRVAQDQPNTWEGSAGHSAEDAGPRSPSVHCIPDSHIAQPPADPRDFQGLEAQPNIHFQNDSLLGPGPVSEFPSLFENSVLSSDDEGYFDSFFDNFPNLSFPSALGEPFLAGQNLLA